MYYVSEHVFSFLFAGHGVEALTTIVLYDVCLMFVFGPLVMLLPVNSDFSNVLFSEPKPTTLVYFSLLRLGQTTLSVRHLLRSQHKVRRVDNGFLNIFHWLMAYLMITPYTLQIVLQGLASAPGQNLGIHPVIHVLLARDK